MDSIFREILSVNMPFLQANVKVTSRLLGNLFAYGIVDEEKQEIIQSKPTENGKVMELISIVSKSGEKSYEQFIEALRKSDHNHVADYLTREGKEKREQHDLKNILMKELDSTEGNEHIANNIARKVQDRCNKLIQDKDEEIQKLRSQLPVHLHGVELHSDRQEHHADTEYESIAIQLVEEKQKHAKTLAEYTIYRNTYQPGAMKLYKVSQHQISELQDDKAKLLIQSNEIESQLKKKDTEHSMLMERVDQLTKELGLDSTSTHNSAMEAIRALQEKTQRLEKNSAQLRKLLETLEQDLIKNRDEKDSLSLELAKQNGILRTREEKIEQLQRVVQKIENSKVTLGLDPDASIDELDKAIKRLALNPNEDAKKKHALFKKSLSNWTDQYLSIRQTKMHVPYIPRFPINFGQKPALPQINNTQEKQKSLGKYCVLCRTQLDSGSHKSPCIIHGAGFMTKRWVCCGKKLDNPGCLYIHHFFIELKDNKLVLTNGDKEVILRWNTG